MPEPANEAQKNAGALCSGVSVSQTKKSKK
jgi:hypothetical protein